MFALSALQSINIYYKIEEKDKENKRNRERDGHIACAWLPMVDVESSHCFISPNASNPQNQVMQWMKMSGNANFHFFPYNTVLDTSIGRTIELLF